MRGAAAGLAGTVGRHQRDAHALARHRMFGQVTAGQTLDFAVILPGQIELEFRRRVKRGCAFRHAKRLDDRMGFLQAVIVFGREAHFQRAVDGPARHVVESDAGRLVGDDVEDPLLAIGGNHPAFGDIHGEGARRDGLIRRTHRRLNSDLTACTVGARRLRRKLLQCACHFRFEGDFLAAVAAGHADRQLGGLRHGNRVAVGRITPGQENRCAAGISGRRDPGIETNIRIERADCRPAAERIGNRACAVGIGKTEGSDQKQRRNGAQRQPVITGDIGFRQAGVERGDALRHADLVFFPERAGKWRVKGRFVFLHADRLVRETVPILEEARRVIICRPFQPEDRQKRGDKTENQHKNDAKPQEIRHVPVKAEPGKRQKYGGDGEWPQGFRCDFLAEQHDFREEAFSRDQAGKVWPLRECAGRALSACPVLSGCGHQSVLPVLATSNAIPGTASCLYSEGQG